MSLTSVQMQAILSQIKPLLKDASFSHFFEMESRRYVLLFGPKPLLLCLLEPYLRFHLMRYTPGENGKKESPWTKKIEGYLKGLFLHDMQLLNDDRILMLTFKGKHLTYNLVVEFFSKRPNIYLLDAQKAILEVLHPVPCQHYSHPVKHLAPLIEERVGLTEMISSDSIEQFYQAKEKAAEFEREKRELVSQLTTFAKRIKKRKEKIQEDLQNCLEWEQMHHEAQLLQSQLYRIKRGAKEVVIQDWENENTERTIVLDPLVEPHIEISKRFQKAKKLRAGIPHCYLQIEKMEKELQKNIDLLTELTNLQTFHELVLYREKYALLPPKKGLTSKKEKALPFREFTTAAGLKLCVGKSAKDNEALTFQYAKGSDWWFHVNDFPGSHVILRIGKNQQPDEESIKDATQVAIFYSKVKEKGEADICITQCKYVSRLGQKKKGQVHISKHHVIHAKWDPLRWQLLKERENKPLSNK